MHKTTSRRHLLGTLGGLAATALTLPSAWAQAGAPGGKLAVLSMAGADISLHEHVQQAGSRIPPKAQTLNLGRGMLDQRATLALDRRAGDFVPKQSIVLLGAQGQLWEELQRDAISTPSGMADMIATIADVGRRAGCRQALALIKHRGTAKLALADTRIGQGMLEGLGFYIDTTVQTTIVGTQRSSIGVIAPFAYLKLLLVDTEQVKLVRSEYVENSFAIPVEPGTIGHPWDAMSAQDKAQAMERLIQESVDKLVPRLLGPQAAA